MPLFSPWLVLPPPHLLDSTSFPPASRPFWGSKWPRPVSSVGCFGATGGKGSLSTYMDIVRRFQLAGSGRKCIVFLPIFHWAFHPQHRVKGSTFPTHHSILQKRIPLTPNRAFKIKGKIKSALLSPAHSINVPQENGMEFCWCLLFG